MNFCVFMFPDEVRIRTCSSLPMKLFIILNCYSHIVLVIVKCVLIVESRLVFFSFPGTAFSPYRMIASVPTRSICLKIAKAYIFSPKTFIIIISLDVFHIAPELLLAYLNYFSSLQFLLYYE